MCEKVVGVNRIRVKDKSVSFKKRRCTLTTWCECEEAAKVRKVFCSHSLSFLLCDAQTDKPLLTLGRTGDTRSLSAPAPEQTLLFKSCCNAQTAYLGAYR